MTPATLPASWLRMPSFLRALFAVGGLLLLASPFRAAQPAATAVISGTVTNKTTGNGLEGARVEIPQLGLSTLVDNTGRYVFTGVPAGSYDLVASYTSLDPTTAHIDVAAGVRTTRDFELTSSVYMLDTFKVAGEKEGLAAAITLQRNADNLTNVVSMDAYGNLPNLNATELAIRLPGVTFGNPGDEVVEVISVRGMGAGMSTITIDGGMMSSFSAQNRNTRMTAFTGAMFEALEVIKGHTPDKGADSLGGTVNFKTRSPLNMRERRRISYNFSVSGVPPGTDQVPIREEHRYHPLFNGAYLQKFRVFGSQEDNLAVSVNLFYSENAFGFFRSQRDYQQTNNQPAYLWDYRTTDNYNNRKQMSVNTKWDYRLSLNSLLRLNLIVNDAPEPMRRQYITRAFAGSATTNPSATSGVVPGFTDRITTVRANAPAANANPGTTPTAAIDLTSTLINRNQRLRHIDLGGEHTFGRFEYDWATLYSLTRYRTLGKEGQLITRIGGIPVIAPNGAPGTATNTIVGPRGERGVGWILDRTESDLYPRFIQNGGLDFTDPGNYRPTQNGLNSNSGDLQQHRVRDLRGNMKYRLPIDAFTATLKTGAQMREQTVSLWRPSRRRWSYVGSGPLPHDPSIVTWDRLRTGRAIPQWEAAMFIENGQPKDPSLWREDLYHNESNKYIGMTRVQETVYATYLMTQGRVGKNGFLAGVRGERTDTTAEAYERARRMSTNAERLADPVAAAARDYPDWETIYGSYTKYFPSVHLWRNLTPNLKLRGAWSTSFGRPSMANALPTLSIDENNQRLTVGNPALLPQTAKNWDFTLEYYFEPSGSISLGWFHKTIQDYIVNNVEVGVVPGGPDNGYDGEYEGFALRMNRNAGQAIAQGWEVSYLQQFRFLPGVLRGLTFNGNLTVINTHGDFGSAGAYRNKYQVPGFIPYSGNVNLSWKYRKFGTRVLYNYTSTHIRSYNAAQPSRNQYMWRRELYNLGFEYNVRSNVKLTLDIANAFNEPQRYYRGQRDQLENFLMQGTKWTAGVQGQF